MATNALVQTRIDSVIKDRAASVLNQLGLTVSDAVRILLTRTANEGALPFALVIDPVTDDAWFRSKVQQALDDMQLAVANDQAETRFAKRRASALRKVAGKT